MIWNKWSHQEETFNKALHIPNENGAIRFSNPNKIISKSSLFQNSYCSSVHRETKLFLVPTFPHFIQSWVKEEGWNQLKINHAKFDPQLINTKSLIAYHT